MFRRRNSGIHTLPHTKNLRPGGSFHHSLPPFTPTTLPSISPPPPPSTLYAPPPPEPPPRLSKRGHHSTHHDQKEIQETLKKSFPSSDNVTTIKSIEERNEQRETHHRRERMVERSRGPSPAHTRKGNDKERRHNHSSRNRLRCGRQDPVAAHKPPSLGLLQALRLRPSRGYGLLSSNTHHRARW